MEVMLEEGMRSHSKKQEEITFFQGQKAQEAEIMENREL